MFPALNLKHQRCTWPELRELQTRALDRHAPTKLVDYSAAVATG